MQAQPMDQGKNDQSLLTPVTSQNNIKDLVTSVQLSGNETNQIINDNPSWPKVENNVQFISWIPFRDEKQSQCNVIYQDMQTFNQTVERPCGNLRRPEDRYCVIHEAFSQANPRIELRTFSETIQYVGNNIPSRLSFKQPDVFVENTKTAASRLISSTILRRRLVFEQLENMAQIVSNLLTINAKSDQNQNQTDQNIQSLLQEVAILKNEIASIVSAPVTT